jgi:hypothetical protein
MPQVLAPEDQQVALHDDATAGLDQQFAQVDDVEHVIPLVHAELGRGHGEIPHLARGDPAGQDAHEPGGERQVDGEPGPVGVIDVPVGVRVGLAAVVHALAEAAPGGQGRVEEPGLTGPPFGRADEAEPPDVVDAGQPDERGDGLAGQQPPGVVAELAGAGQEAAQVGVGQEAPDGAELRGGGHT